MKVRLTKSWHVISSRDKGSRGGRNNTPLRLNGGIDRVHFSSTTSSDSRAKDLANKLSPATSDVQSSYAAYDV